MQASADLLLPALITLITSAELGGGRLDCRVQRCGRLSHTLFPFYKTAVCFFFFVRIKIWINHLPKSPVSDYMRQVIVALHIL